MLPEQIVELLDGFVRAFDSENPVIIECRKAHNKAASLLVKMGTGWGGLSVALIGKELTGFLEKRTQFIWGKLQEVIISIDVDFYPGLNEDLKSKLESDFNPTRRAIERYIEEIRISTQAPTGFSLQFKTAFDNIIQRLFAEVNLFCAKYSMQQKKKNSIPSIVYNFTGHNARVNIGSTDYSINVANSEKIFDGLKKAIQDGIENVELKNQLLEKTAELEKTVSDKPTYMKRYSEWIALAANHMTLIAPWIPALTHFMTQQQ